MENNIPQEGTPVQPTPVQPIPSQPIPVEPTPVQPVQPQPTPVPAQPIQSTQPIIQVIMPDNKPAEVDTQPEVIQTPAAVEAIELSGENNILKDTNKLYGAMLIILSLVVIAGVAYWIGTFKSPNTVVVPNQLDSINPTYTPTPSSTNPNNLPYNTLPPDSNPQGSDTAPPGGITAD